MGYCIYIFPFLLNFKEGSVAYIVKIFGVNFSRISLRIESIRNSRKLSFFQMSEKMVKGTSSTAIGNFFSSLIVKSQ